jgi:hypothetical protein
MKRIALAMLFMLVLLVTPAQSEIVKDNFHLYAPIDMFENTGGMLVIKLVNRNLGSPMTGMANNISCYIKYPDGTFLIDGTHPIQEVPGIYLLYFSVGEITGIYHCWTTCSYNANLTLMDAGLFTVKWDVYENVSRLYERIGGIIYLEHWENYNMTQQFAYALSLQDIKLQNISRTVQKTDFFSNLQQIAMNQAIGVLFWTVALTAFSILSAILYTRRRSRRKQLEALAASTSVPQAFVGGLAGNLRRRKL